MRATLTSLRIRQLALVEELTWELAPGFTAITGETGSGKSIIVGALKLILGERADRSIIRAGAESCTVEAVFALEADEQLNAWLLDQGLEGCEERQLLIKRVTTTAGANRQFINGSPATLAVLKRLGEDLVDLHGPHDHQSLLAAEKQLELVDAFAAAAPALSKYGGLYRRLRELESERESLAADESALERELDLLRHQAREIESAQLTPEDDLDLLSRYQKATQSRRLLELASEALGRLAEADDALLPRLMELARALRELERLDPEAATLSETHGRAVTELEELAASLQTYAAALDLDPARLAALEERVTLLETLKRKYGGSLEEVAAFGDRATERLRKIEGRGAELERLNRESEAAREALLAAGRTLGKARQAAAPKLAAQVAAHLRDLGFQKAGFSIQILSLAEPGPHGLESAEFLFAPNPGEPAQPLRAIASSGEISRVMLALKTALATQDPVALLVFDEIDANVGGEIAHAVGAKMRTLARAHQVLCISHLPQVAALAEAQFVVTKETAHERTTSQLRAVAGKERLQEIARMLGGQTDSALAHARTLLAAGN